MVSDPDPEPLEGTSVDRRCHVCGHGESEHELREVVAIRERQPYCTECDDWHDFVPSPLDV